MKEYPRHLCGGDFFVTPAAKKVIKTYIKLYNNKKVIKSYITRSCRQKFPVLRTCVNMDKETTLKGERKGMV